MYIPSTWKNYCKPHINSTESRRTQGTSLLFLLVQQNVSSSLQSASLHHGYAIKQKMCRCGKKKRKKKKRPLLPLDLRKNPQAALAFIEKLMLCPGCMFQNIYLPWHVRCPSSGRHGWKHIYFQVGIELLSSNLSWGACAEAQKQNHCRVVLQVLQGKQTASISFYFYFYYF